MNGKKGVKTLEKAILVNDNGFSSQAGLIIGDTKEEIIKNVVEDIQSLCNEESYEILENTEFKFAIQYKRKSWNDLIVSTLHFNIMDDLMLKCREK